MSYDFDTRCIHIEEQNEDFWSRHYGAVSFPIYQTSTYVHAGVGNSTGFDYSRLQNPTRQQVEKIVAGLEEGVDALGFASGMAAISAMMEIFVPGDHLIIDEDLYGGSIRLFEHISTKNGIQFTAIDTGRQKVDDYIKPNTKAVFLETPTNPMMNVTDIEALSRVTKAHGIWLIIDNTFLSPYFQKPLLLGADLVVHSGTKYLGGHNDTLAGFLVPGNEEIAERLRFIIKTTGGGLSPFDSWLILRGIKTLPLRMDRAQENAFAIADWLLKQKEVTKVIYPGLKDHPGYEIMKKQASGFGSMLTFEVESEEFAKKILGNVKLIHFAESLGGTETLITYPVTQTHADVPAAQREKTGITGRILRLSVGIESSKDLIAELERVFQDNR